MRTNCFNTFVPQATRPSLVLRHISGSTVEGLEFDGNRHAVLATRELVDINSESIEVTHFYGLDEVRYEGIRQVALGLWTKWPYAWVHYLRLKNAVDQRRFNSRPLVLGERFDILRDVVAATARGVDAVDALNLMSFRFGNRWAGHPDWQMYQKRLEKQLELLSDSGDLTASDHFSYRPTGSGARAVDERKDAARKHGANWWVQMALVVLAVLALVFAAAQAGFVRLPTVLDLTSTRAAQPVDTPAVKP